MHRSRLPVLVIFAAAAACSKRDASEGNAILSEDRTLVARLDVDQESHKTTLPTACGTIAIPAQPAVANQHQADELTRQARDAEMHGDVGEARSLLRRAVELDGTNKSAAYHLGRTSEALGDSSAAMTAYCRYLALTPTTAEAVEAHQRVTQLSQAKVRVATGSVTDSSATTRQPALVAKAAPAPRPTRAPTAARRAVASTTVARSAPATSRQSSARSASTIVRAEEVSPAPQAPATATSEVASTTNDSSAAGGDVVMTSREPAVEQPAPAPRASSRYPTRAQGAGIGAVAGAILGGATGRSMKSAVIGAAAGGLLGTMVGRTPSRPVGRGIVPWSGT